jgi:biopolymer transport protein ExbD
MKVVFDPAGRIGGMWMVPSVQPEAAATPPASSAVPASPAPTAPAASPAPEQAAAQVVINIRADGTYIIDKKQTDPATLKARLKELATKYPDQAVILRADKTVSYKFVTDALDLCKEAGIWNVAFSNAAPQ